MLSMILTYTNCVSIMFYMKSRACKFIKETLHMKKDSI